MDTAIAVAIITGLFTGTASVIASLVSASKNRALMEQELKYQQKQIDALAESVKTHNDYARQIPLMNQRIEYMSDEVKRIREYTERD